MEKKHVELLIMEDDAWFNEMLRSFVTSIATKAAFVNHHFNVRAYQSPMKCIAEMKVQPDIAIIDYYLSDDIDSLTGMDVLKAIKEKCEGHCKVIIISQHTGRNTIEALKKEGAYDYITKDLNAFDKLEKILVDLMVN